MLDLASELPATVSQCLNHSFPEYILSFFKNGVLLARLIPARRYNYLQSGRIADATADASGGNYAKNEEARIRYEDMRDDEDGTGMA